MICRLNPESCFVLNEATSLPLPSQSIVSSCFTTQRFEIRPKNGKMNEALERIHRLMSRGVLFTLSMAECTDCSNSNDATKALISEGLHMPTVLFDPRYNEKGFFEATIFALNDHSAGQSAIHLAQSLTQTSELRRILSFDQQKQLFFIAVISLQKEMQLAATTYRISAERKMLLSRQYPNGNAHGKINEKGEVQLGPRLRFSVSPALAARIISSQITSNRSISNLLSTKSALGNICNDYLL